MTQSSGIDVTLNVTLANTWPSIRENVIRKRWFSRPKGGALGRSATVWNVLYRSGGAVGWA